MDDSFLDDIFSDNDEGSPSSEARSPKKLLDDDFQSMRGETSADEEIEFPDFDRPTVAAHPEDIEAASRQTVIASIDEIAEPEPQKHGTREGFDERLAKVKARKDDDVPVAVAPSPPQPPASPPPVARPQKRRKPLLTWECLASAMGFGLLSGVLVIVALFLPPISDYNPLVRMISGEGGETFSNSNRQVEKDGLTVEVLPNEVGDGFKLAIQSASAADYLAGNVPAEWDCQAASTLPRYAPAVGQVYSLAASGEAPKRVGLNVALPSGTDPLLVDMYGQFGSDWLFIPKQMSADQTQFVTDLPTLPSCVVLARVNTPLPIVGATLDFNETLAPDQASVVNRVYIRGLLPTAQGDLQGALPTGVDTNAGYTVIPVISNFTDPAAIDVNTLATLLSSPEARQSHSDKIVSFVTESNYDRVAIDYRQVNLRNQFSDFIKRLADGLHAQNRSLIVILPEPVFTTGWSGEGYDWRTLGLLADEVVMRAPLNPLTFASGGDFELMLQWALGEVHRYKLFIGLSALPVEFIPNSPTLTTYTAAAWEGITGVRFEANGANQYQAQLDSPYEVELGVYSDIETPYVSYSQNANLLRAFWFTTPKALQYRLSRLNGVNLGGVILFDFYDAQANTLNLTPVVRAYLEGTPLDVTSEGISLQWRFTDENGGIIQEEIVQPDTPMIYSAAEGETLVRAEVQVVGDIIANLGNGELNLTAGQESAAAPSVEVAVQPTPTEAQTAPLAVVATPTVAEVAVQATPIPTETPLPTATFTPSPIPPTPTIVPTINAPELQGKLPADFEIGIHHSGDLLNDTKWNWMRVGKMQWVKLQLRFDPGMNPEDEGWKIQFIHEQGFKVLFGVVGDKNSVLQDGYFQQFSEYVAGLAQRGADAIEVWNEPNLDREWPTGQVSGARYTDFLKVAYPAIKAANPNTMVISGATAPTGFFGGCQNGGCDDNVFYQQMAQAGAAQYLDCIGAHYNEGIVSPAQDTGDPRNPYPTQYLVSNTKRASDPFGGQVPVCYTELGFLTSEGYSAAIPPGFEWAQNVTLAQQASWLATAALRLSQETNVRLMIIWNLDYTDFNPDPHGGYAIMRPDGSCPACDSLGSIREVQPLIGAPR